MECSILDTGQYKLVHDIIDILEPDRTEREFLKNVAEIYCEKKYGS